MFPSRAASAALLLLALLTACGPIGPSDSGLSNRRVDPPPDLTPAPGAAPAATPNGSARSNPLQRPAMSAADLEVAYRAIMDRFIDPVDHQKLIQVATTVLRDSLSQEAAPPMLTLPLDMQPAPTKNPTRDWAGFASAYDAVIQKMPGWAARVHPDWMVLRAMAQSLDDGHTFFRTPDEVRRSAETTYGGIGVGLAASDQGRGPLISEVFPSSPAERAGMRRGDRIVSVDGQDLAGRTLAEIVQLIRGETGSAVGLKVQRLSSPSPMDLRLTRAQVQIDPVQALRTSDSSLGYLRIRNFNAEQIGEIARQAVMNGARSGIRGWVLDLRGNPGGLVPVVRTVAGLFVENKPIGYEVDRDGNKTAMMAEGAAIVRNVPLVVLVDHDTASGAEILAAALRDYGVAQIVGVPTAGNVEVATTLDLTDGSRFQVSVRRYESSKNERMDKVGVQPDVVIEQRDADLEAGRDTQLSRATELLTQKLAGR